MYVINSGATAFESFYMQATLTQTWYKTTNNEQNVNYFFSKYFNESSPSYKTRVPGPELRVCDACLLKATFQNLPADMDHYSCDGDNIMNAMVIIKT